ncbi:MAG: NTP transferase domain-containing protein, partial [Bacteroidota bacterium]
MQNEKLVSDITGVILAGGSSKRMGVNKSLLKIDDLTLIEKVNEIM